MPRRTRGGNTSTDRQRSRARWLLSLGALALGGMLTVATDASAASYSATASLAPNLYYIGDSTGSLYTFTVKNTGSTTRIGAVEINRPSTGWKIITCPSPPSGWTSQRSDGKCRFRSPAGTWGDIAPGASKTFVVKATTSPGTANRVGTWKIVVSSSNQFDKPSLLKPASPTGGGLTTKLYTFELTTAVVSDTLKTPGTPCPAENKEAVVGSTKTIVVCGKNRATTTLTPTSTYSHLSGTFIKTPGVFLSGPIPANSANVVLADWNATEITDVFGAGKKVIAGIGSASNRTSPLRTFTGYSATSAPPVANDDAYSVNEDTQLSVPAVSGVLANDTDAESDPLTAALVTSPTHGDVVFNSDGSFTYDPDPDYHGPDSFTYKANDTHSDSAPATVSITVDPVNDAPVATAVTDSTDEDTPKAITLTATDIDGDTLTYSIVTGPAHGSLGAVTGNSVTYTPDQDYTGADSFEFKANDGSADSNTVTASLTVNPVNDAPVADDDAYNTDEDTALNVTAPGVLADDTDVEGDPLTAKLVSGPTHAASFTLNADGSFDYTPAADYNGPDSFTYVADDGPADSNLATVSITVGPVNDLPVAQAVSASTPEDTAKEVTLVATDTEGSTLTYSIVTGPTHGSLGAVTGDKVTYTPDADYFGADSFTYKANDGSADSNTATVSLTVNSVNDVPVAGDDAYNTNEDTALNVSAPGVLADDTDVESALTAVLVSGPAHASSFTLNADGSFDYTPAANYNGPDSFTYTANDGTVDSNVATVDITVDAVNDAPVAQAVSASTPEDTAKEVTLVATDTEGSTLTYSIVTGPTHGSLGAVVGDKVTYTPDADYFGADSFTYKANDGSADSNTATVSLTVNSVNDVPTSADDAYSTDEDTPLNVSAPGVLGNDSDVESALTAVLVSGPAHDSSFTLNADGSFDYTPDANYNGPDSFTYTANDGTVDSPVATVSLTVDPVNDAPVAQAVSASTPEDTAKEVTLVATDTEGSTLTYSIVTGPTHGSLGAVVGDKVTYTPDADYAGSDSFTYKANDGSADSNTATVSLTVTAVNDAPVAVDDAYQAIEDTALVVLIPGVLGNDTDADPGDTLTAGNASNPANGSVTLNADGSFTYTPDAGYLGADSFTYDVSDGTTTDSGTVDITVVPPNATPTADATSASGNEDGGAITVTLTGHDADDDNLTFNPGTATNGLVTVSGAVDCTTTANTCTTTVTYTPNANFNGSDSFTYTVDDGPATSAPATATVTVTAVNDEPSFTKGADQTVLEDAGPRTVTGWVAAASPGPANESAQGLSYEVTGTTNDALFSSLPLVSPSGVLTYTPAVNANGSATVSVRVMDDGGTANGGDDTSPTQTFLITVTAVNDVPSFTKGADQGTVALPLLEDAGAQSVSGWATAISKGPADESAQTLTFTVTNDNNALFSSQPAVSPTGTLTYTSAANAVGSATVSMSLTDSGGTANGGDDTSDVQTFTVTVDGVNDEPSFTHDGDQTVLEDAGARTVNGFVNTTSAGPADESAQVVTVSVTGQTNAALFSVLPSIDSAGTLTYTPAVDANGVSTVTARATDSGGTANGGDDTGPDMTFVITVTAVNDEPSFTKGADQGTVALPLLEDAGAQSVSNWATAISKGPANESAQTVSFIVTNDNNALFSSQPAVSPTGTLTYTSSANKYGTATVSVSISDNGGTANGGDDTSPVQTFVVTVNAVNDAPVAEAKAFTVQANMKISLSGLLVNATDPNDVNGGSTATPPVVHTPSFTLGNVFTGDGCVGCTVSNVDNANGTFDFDPPAGGSGVNAYTLTYTVVDNGFPAPGATSAPATITFTVNGPVVWFVDEDAATVGTGRLSEPFQNLASATTAMGTDTNERIHVEDGNSTGNVVLQTNSWLISDTITGASFDSVMGITPPAGTIARPSNAGAPQRTLTGSVTLGDTSVARGFNLTPGSGTQGLIGNGADGVTVNTMSITTTNARAVNLTSSSGTFALTAVNSNGGDRGISLDGVNTSSGSFTITGTGSAGSGGTVQSATSAGTTGAGIYLNNSRTISLDRMIVTNNTGSGIYGATVTTFTLANSTISNNGTSTTDDHSGVNFDNLTGTSSMTGLTVFGSEEHNIVVENTTGTANLTVSNSTIRDSTPVTGGNGLYVNSAAGGNAVVNVTVSNNAIERHRITGLQLFSQGSGKMTSTVSGGTYLHNGQGIDIASNGTGGHAFSVTGGTLTGCVACIATDTVPADVGVGVNVFKGLTGTGTGTNALSGTVTGMTINMGGSSNAPAIWVHGGGGPGEVRTALTNNNISNTLFNGAIWVATGANSSGSQVWMTTITGNTVSTNAGNAANAIHVQSGTNSTDNTFTCAHIANNNANSPDAGDIRVWNRFTGTTLRLPGYAGGATDTTAVINFLKAQNTITDAEASVGTSSGFSNGAACTLP